MSQVCFEVQGSWDGRPLAQGEFARIEARIDRASGAPSETGERHALEVRVEATYYDDPAPAAPPGSFMTLWEYEVVELFLLGEEDRYLEIELGPHGHHLGLGLAGRRRVVERSIPMDFRVERSGVRWHGEARISLDWLPAGIRAGNAYAIHGQGAARRYLATHPVPGPEPDFHRLECFAPLSLD